MTINNEVLDRFVGSGSLASYSLERKDDTGSDPYMSLTLTFEDGTSLIIEPGLRMLDGTQRLDIYGKR